MEEAENIFFLQWSYHMAVDVQYPCSMFNVTPRSTSAYPIILVRAFVCMQEWHRSPPCHS
jgi:hypothetical protein